MKCECEVVVGRLLQEKETEVRKAPCPIASLCTTYSRGPKWNRTPDFCDERPATNYLNHGAACLSLLPLFRLILILFSSGITVRGES
jgi:hypothetical protein